MRERTRQPTHPGAILNRQYLQPLNLTISELARRLGISRNNLSKIINGRGSITPNMALRLSKGLGTTPELWLNMQQTYDLWKASHESKEWKNIKQVTM